MADMKPVALLLQILSILSSLLIVVSGVLWFVWSGYYYVAGWILNIFLVLFGIFTLIADLKSFPLFGYVAFIYNPIGKGIFLIFVGALCLGWHAFQIAAGCIVMVTGLLFIVIGQFVLEGGMPKPLTERDATPSLIHEEKWV